LGSGFNPEFTGRENIYLSGLIMGMSKKDMDEKISEIEHFADIGNYIDLPLRTYSTGMQMRLAFAVATAVRPDILVIDEALSVGDILFQQKCSFRLKELKKQGITLILVTHDVGSVLSLCENAIWIEKGNQKYLGSSADCIKLYLAAMAAKQTGKEGFSDTSKHLQVTNGRSMGVDISKCQRLGGNELYIEYIYLKDEDGLENNIVKVDAWCEIILGIKSRVLCRNVSCGIELRNRHGQPVFVTGLRVINQLISKIEPGEVREVKIKFKMLLAPGQYSIDVGCGSIFDNNNYWQKVLGSIVLEVPLLPEQQTIHGLVKLPFIIE